MQSNTFIKAEVKASSYDFHSKKMKITLAIIPDGDVNLGTQAKDIVFDICAAVKNIVENYAIKERD